MTVKGMVKKGVVMKKLLYPTDGSKTARAALEFVLDIAKAQNWEILVLSVAEKIASFGIEYEEFDEVLMKLANDFAQQAVAEIKKRGAKVEARIEKGKPAETILAVAKEEGVDAIVMGTHGWTGLVRAVIGSVADRVVRHAPCPVVLVPTKAED